MKKFFSTLFFLHSVVFAAGSGLYENNSDVKEALANAYEPNWFSMLLSLCVVIALIYLTGFIYQKLLKVKLDKSLPLNEIEIVAAKSLGQNKNLYIVRVNDEHLLIGATQSNITYIKDIQPLAEEEKEN